MQAKDIFYRSIFFEHPRLRNCIVIFSHSVLMVGNCLFFAILATNPAYSLPLAFAFTIISLVIITKCAKNITQTYMIIEGKNVPLSFYDVLSAFLQDDLYPVCAHADSFQFI